MNATPNFIQKLTGDVALTYWTCVPGAVSIGRRFVSTSDRRRYDGSDCLTIGVTTPDEICLTNVVRCLCLTTFSALRWLVLAGPPRFRGSAATPAPPVSAAPPDTNPAPPGTNAAPPDTRPAPVDISPAPSGISPAPPDTTPAAVDTNPVPPDTSPVPVDISPTMPMLGADTIPMLLFILLLLETLLRVALSQAWIVPNVATFPTDIC